MPLRRVEQGLLCLILLTVAGCADAGLTAPPEAPAATAAATVLNGTYELRTSIPLQDGSELYLVSVYFGPGSATPEYVLQVGVRTSGAGTSLLVQERYTVSGNEVTFAGGLLRPGTLTPSSLRTAVQAGGEWVEVSLPRR